MYIGITWLVLIATAMVSTQAASPSEGDLRVLVAANPPFVLEVESGAVEPIAGLRALSRGTVSVVGVAGRAGVVVADGGAAAELYAVGSRGGRAVRLGAGTGVWPAAGGRAVWVQTRSPSGCLLRQVALDGRRRRAPRQFPCPTRSDPSGGSLGLVVNRTRVVDPHTGGVVLRTRAGILAVAGRKLVLRHAGFRLTLLDAATGAERRLRWPSALTQMDRPAVDPRGRYVVLAFAEPAADPQALDLWLLNVRTARLAQLPDMPARVALKATSIAWTDDGRLVLLGANAGGDVVAVWRPGDKRLRLRPVELPDRDGGSDTFAPLR